MNGSKNINLVINMILKGAYSTLNWIEILSQ